MHSLNRAAPRLASASFSHCPALLASPAALPASRPNVLVAPTPPLPNSASPVADRLRKLSRKQDRSKPTERVAAVLDKMRGQVEPVPSDTASNPPRKSSRASKLKAHQKAKLKAEQANPSKGKAEENETENEKIPFIREQRRKGGSIKKEDPALSSWGPDALAPQNTEWDGAERRSPWENESDGSERRLPPHQIEFSKHLQGSLDAHVSSGPVLSEVKLDMECRPIATLSHGIDRVLFNPGVHWLQDPRSRVYNFTPWLEKVPKVNEFAFDRVKRFVKSSEDQDLIGLAKREGKKFCGSTSSLSGLLSQAYFLISDGKEVDTSVLSTQFHREPKTFTPSQRMPVSVYVKHHDGVHAIDSHSDESTKGMNILLWLGVILEKFLTTTPEQFKRYLHSSSGPVEEEQDPRREAYRFSSSDKFVMRSQLDCVDPRLPGTGVFDLKTRACMPIRLDILNYEEGSGYVIRSQHGILESFEREYYDLIRSAFLKYGFQARIGNMDGVLVAYHNTDRIFGFQYVPLAEMDERLFGPGEGVGDLVFSRCLGLMENVMEEATQLFPGKDTLMFAHTDANSRTLNVYVQPADWAGEEEERPIRQLAVKVSNFLGAAPTSPSAAVRSGRKDWRVEYEIFHVAVPEEEMRGGLEMMKKLKEQSMVLPTGVGLGEEREFCETVRFGDQKEGDMSKVIFRLADKRLEALRSLARQGRLETQEREELEKDLPKIVFGEKEPWRG